MKLTIKPNAIDLLETKITDDNQVIFLALNDGSSKYSKVGGTCSIGANFQLVIVPYTKERIKHHKKDSSNYNENYPIVPINIDDEYNIILENDSPYCFLTSKPELTFLGSNLVIDAKNAVLSLKDDSGIIDGAMTIQKIDNVINHTNTVSKKDQQKLSGKMC